MALQPDDTGLFVWPPPHWADTLGLALPDAEQPVVGMPDIPPAPQQFGQSLDPATIQLTTPAPVVVPPPVPLPPAPVETPGPDVAAAPPPLPLEHEQPGALQPGLGIPTEAIDAAGVALTPPPITLDPNSPDDLVALAHRDPIGYAQYLATQDEARAKEARARLAPVMADDKHREEQDHRDYMDSMAEADRLSQEVRNTQINPNRFREHQTALEGVASFLSVVVGGLYQARHGGPNIGLQILDKAIDRDIAAQESNLANKRSLIADLRSQGLSRFQAQEAFRVATYNRALQDVQTSMQDYDPRGTAARNLARQALEIESRIAQSSEAVRRNALDENLKLRKDARESAESLSKLRKDDLEAEKLRAKLGGGGVGGAAAPGIIDRNWAAANGFTTLPPEGVTFKNVKEFSSWLEARGKDNNISAPEREAARKQAEDLRDLSIAGVDGNPLTNANGHIYLSPKDVAGETRKKLHAARQITNIIDETLDILDKSSAMDKSSWINSPYNQRLRVLENQLTIIAKSGTQGMSSDEDMKRISGALGAGDLTSLRSQAAGLREGRARTVDAANSWLVDHNYTGPALTFSSRYGTPTQTDDDRLVQESAADGKGGGLARAAATVAAAADNGGKVGSPSKAERERVDKVAAPAFGTDPAARTAAIDRISKMIETSGSATERAYAVSVFREAIAGQHPVAAPPPPAPEPVHARPAKDQLLYELEQRPKQKPTTSFDAGDWYKERK